MSLLNVINLKWLGVMSASIILGLILRILDVYMGFLLGTERFVLFLVVFPFSLLVAVGSELIWWIVMSYLGRRV